MTALERAEALVAMAEQIATAAQEFCDALDALIESDRRAHEALLVSLEKAGDPDA